MDSQLNQLKTQTKTLQISLYFPKALKNMLQVPLK